MKDVTNRLDWSVEKIKEEAIRSAYTRKPGKETKTIEVVDLYAEQGEGTRVFTFLKYRMVGATDQIMTRVSSLWSEEGEMIATKLVIGKTFIVQVSRCPNGYWAWVNAMEFV
jgi:hypothetical protein